MYDKAGKSRGFAFVEFASVLNAAKAMSSMNGKKVLGMSPCIDHVEIFRTRRAVRPPSRLGCA